MNDSLEDLLDSLKEKKPIKKPKNNDLCFNCNEEITNIDGEMICQHCGTINYGLIDINAEM